MEEGREALVTRLTERGLEAVADGRLVLVALGDDTVYDAVRDAVAARAERAEVPGPRRHSLEDLFRGEVSAA